MSDEEKKAIDELKEEINKPLEVPEDKFNTFILYNIESAKTILNLIKKQSKEIEELKDKNKSIVYNYEMVVDKLENSTPNDKIKAKIEELQEDIKYSANPLSIDNSKFGIKVLQLLLEKE